MSQPIPPAAPGTQQIIHQVAEVAPGVMRFVLASGNVAVQFDLPTDVMRGVCARGLEACEAAARQVKLVSALPGLNGKLG